jgi:hypothetical protein
MIEPIVYCSDIYEDYQDGLSLRQDKEPRYGVMFIRLFPSLPKACESVCGNGADIVREMPI